MKAGQILEVRATDPAFGADVESWCNRTGNEFKGSSREGKVIKALIKKGIEKNMDLSNVSLGGNDKTMVVFSGDLDKAIASFIIANGAAAMGRKVTMFFTFWGLNVLRKNDNIKVKKSFLESMFGMMMPRGTSKLGLSKMNMGGMGGKMIRYIMDKKNVFSLDELIEQAKVQGVRLVACSMSMDIMGIKEEELIPGIEIGGVASYLASAETADTNLFI
ncbi:SirA-like protein [Oxobacter pfennigii]|uniref:SirA-like protein n=1 Tax=Oxobacter pfennigii TaxID=36849 RepID=A0A0P8W952_9CLOT|nr:SirA-like protein [Oxobacter pfennigii]